VNLEMNHVDRFR